MVSKLDLLKQAGDLDSVRQSLAEAVERRRPALVYGMAKLFFEALSAAVLPDPLQVAQSEGWETIESLSQLRALVGGRFQNLKQKWIGAGFPLREHRGDRIADAALDPDGWTELALWINKQGFEARLPVLPGAGLFEVRRLG